MAGSQMMLDNYLMEKRVVVIPGVENIREALQSFKWPDYMICTITLTLSVIIGLYVSFLYTPVTAEEYFLGKKKLKIFPVSISIATSFIGGLLIIKIPSDTYLYGIQHVYLMIGFIAMTFVVNYIFLPVLCRLNLISVYEYLEKRFDKKVRLFGALLYVIYMVIALPMCMFSLHLIRLFRLAVIFGAHSMNINGFKTNLHLNYITPIICTAGIFYTLMGGLKAVIWTDVFHIVIILSSLILINIKGTLDIGEFNHIIERSLQSERVEGPNLALNFSKVNTLWSSMFGGCFYYLYVAAINQNTMQKYLALPSLKDARRASWLFAFILCLIIILCSYCGILIYAMFHQCDPLTTKLATQKNQLLALFVAKVLSEYPGMSGLFVAGIWGGTLSTWATVLNSVTAVVVEDVYPTFFTKQFREKHWAALIKFTLTVLGISCTCLVYTINHMDTVLQISNIIISVTGGSSLGIFTMAIMFPWISAKGALIGGISSLCFMIWFNFKTLITSNLPIPTKSLSTVGCSYHFVPQQIFTNRTDVLLFGEEFFQMSYLWHTLTGVLISVVIAFSISLFLESYDPRDVDSRLLAPFLKKIIKPREFPNEPGDSIIYAFNSSNKITNDMSLECNNMSGS